MFSPCRYYLQLYMVDPYQNDDQALPCSARKTKRTAAAALPVSSYSSSIAELRSRADVQVYCILLPSG